MSSIQLADLPAPEEVIWIARTLQSRGFEAWTVGGGVRDALSGRVPEDWDLTTSARPRDVQRIFRRTVPVGIDHGTVGVLGRSGHMYEVTTFRRDVETDGRRAVVAFSNNLEEDLARRDFTINAVAWNPLTREVRDPHGGMDDLRAGILRTVGEPHARFEEDRLRVLRALRFAGTFGLAIQEDTWQAIRDFRDRLSPVSPERVREELWKVLSKQRTAASTLSMYADSGVLEALYPELNRTLGIRLAGHRVGGADGVLLWEYLLVCVDAIPPSRPLVRLAALLHRVPSADHGTGPVDSSAASAARSAAIARELMQRLRFSNAATDTVTHLIAQQEQVISATSSDGDVRRWTRNVGPEFLRDHFRLRLGIVRAEGKDREAIRELRAARSRAFAVVRSGTPLAVTDLAIGGQDLRALGIKPGPIYGRILEELLELVLDEPRLNQPDNLMREVERILTRRGER